MTGDTRKPAKRGRIQETLRWIAAALCLCLALFWHGSEPPVLDMSRVQVAQGMYECIQYYGSGFGARKPDAVDGHIYRTSFSYIFGLTPTKTCFTSLHRRTVQVFYLPVDNNAERLLLQLTDVETGQIFGLSKERHLASYQRDVAERGWYYVTKLGLFLLALRLTIWNKVYRLTGALIRRFRGPL